MKEKDLVKITVENKRSLGELSGIEIFLTKSLEKDLKNEKTINGENRLELFKKGMALRGFKHLVEVIRLKEKNPKIIFTHKDKSNKNKKQYTISYENYRKATGPRFFSLYREVGLDGAKYFLHLVFLDEFEYDKTVASEEQLRQIDKKFEDSIKKLSPKRKNQKIILEEASIIINRLQTKKNLLKADIDELEKIQKESNIFVFKQKIEELWERLKKKYPETKGKNSWQSWIYKNSWMFGVTYQKPIEKQKINISGSMPDYLFPTVDGFLDILEIKLPSHDVVVKDNSHVGTFRWSGDANKAIGQVVTYLSDIELYQLHLKQQIKNKYNLDLSVIKPRAFILISNSDNWDFTKKESLRKLNFSLHGIEVLTYSDLLQRANEIVEIYNKELS